MLKIIKSIFASISSFFNGIFENRKANKEMKESEKRDQQAINDADRSEMIFLSKECKALGLESQDLQGLIDSEKKEKTPPSRWTNIPTKLANIPKKISDTISDWTDFTFRYGPQEDTETLEKKPAINLAKMANQAGLVRLPAGKYNREKYWGNERLEDLTSDEKNSLVEIVSYQRLGRLSDKTLQKVSNYFDKLERIYIRAGEQNIPSHLEGKLSSRLCEYLHLPEDSRFSKDAEEKRNLKKDDDNILVEILNHQGEAQKDEYEIRQRIKNDGTYLHIGEENIPDSLIGKIPSSLCKRLGISEDSKFVRGNNQGQQAQDDKIEYDWKPVEEDYFEPLSLDDEEIRAIHEKEGNSRAENFLGHNLDSLPTIDEDYQELNELEEFVKMSEKEVSTLLEETTVSPVQRNIKRSI